MTSIKYLEARNIFKDIKIRLEDNKHGGNVSEFKDAVQTLLHEYNTASWENRFVVGGALEVLFCALLNSVGFTCRWLKEARYDIEVNSIKFSVKSNFTGVGDIRLINILGDNTVKWEEPTLFFISERGIFYADPNMGLMTRHASDAVVINIKEIIKIDKQWLININIPRKPSDFIIKKTASYDVAKSILEGIKSRYLQLNFI